MANATLLCKCHGVRQPRDNLIKTPRGNFCSYKLAIEFANKQTTIRNDKAFNKETRRLKESIKKRTGKNGHYDNHKTVLHKYIKHVLRKGESCYTCDLPQKFSDSPQAFHVGHFIPQKQVDPRRFMLENLRIQCNSCNTHNSGMRAEYRARLIEEVGIEHVEWLECDANHKSLKEQYPEVSDIKAETARYRKLTRELT